LYLTTQRHTAPENKRKTIHKSPEIQENHLTLPNKREDAKLFSSINSKLIKGGKSTSMNTNKASTVNLLIMAAFLTTTVLQVDSHVNATEPPAKEVSPANINSKNAATQGDNRKFMYDEETKKTYGPKDPIIWDKPTKVIFNHKIHTVDAGLSCESCHNDIFTMKTGTALKSGNLTMAAMAEGQFCGACHDGSTAFATTTQCGSCHLAPETPIVFTVPVKAVSFEHSIHLKKGGLACEACHKEVFSMKKGSIEEAEKAAKGSEGDKRRYLEQLHNKYCGTCHDSSQAFGYLTRCTVCHIGVKGYDTLPGSDLKKDKQGASKH
jgi:c(7)-type cytochrome triheme protein